MVITYALWWWGVVSHVVVGAVNGVQVLWSILCSNVPGWRKYIPPTTLAMAGSGLDLKDDAQK
jgi:hypothetical protein